MNRAGHALQALIFGGICATGPAVAAKLDRDTCAALAGEHAELASTGIKSEMERGPSWCHANLPPDRLRSVHRLLEIEDQLELRCGRAKRKEPPASPAPGGVPASPGGPTLDARGPVRPPLGGAAAPALASPANNSPIPPVGPGSAAAKQFAMPPAAAHPVASPPPPVATPPVATPAAAAAAPVQPRHPAAAVAAPAAAPTPPAQTKALPATAAAASPAGPVPAPSAPATTQPAIPRGAPAPVTTKALPVVTKQGTSPTAVSPVKTISVTAPTGGQPAAARDTATAALPPVSAAAPHQGVTPQLAPAGTPAPAAGKSSDPAAQAARKPNPRRKPVSAYVPPDEVSPFSLPGLR